MAKAFTANAFSNDKLALSTANLYGVTQPGGSLYGLNNSNPFNPDFDGPIAVPGPGIGKVAGGIITFGGGVALYDNSKVIGGLGVSGDYRLRGSRHRLQDAHETWAEQLAWRRGTTISRYPELPALAQLAHQITPPALQALPTPSRIRIAQRVISLRMPSPPTNNSVVLEIWVSPHPARPDANLCSTCEGGIPLTQLFSRLPPALPVQAGQSRTLSFSSSRQTRALWLRR